MKRLARFLAFFAAPFSPRIRCRFDMHDYPDSQHGQPWHFTVHACKRCGKYFTI
jgi:hypothetical protein